MRTLRNAASALVVVGVVALALYLGVEITAGVAGASPGAGSQPSYAVAVAGQTYLCPQTGCSASSCHAIGGTNPVALSGGSSDGSGSGTGELQTCPRTGCTASSCHGATGSPPPSSGGSGYGGYGGSGMGMDPGYGRGYGRGYSGGNAAAPVSPAPIYE